MEGRHGFIGKQGGLPTALGAADVCNDTPQAQNDDTRLRTASA
jgi:hypothetical protein